MVKQSVERHSFPVTRLLKITRAKYVSSGQLWLLSNGTWWRHIGKVILLKTHMQARFTVPGQHAGPLSEAAPDPSGQSVLRGALTEEDLIEKTRSRKRTESFMVSGKRAYHKEKRKGRRETLNIHVKHGRVLQLRLCHPIIFPLYIHQVTLCLFCFSLSCCDFVVSYFSGPEKTKLEWIIVSDITESAQKRKERTNGEEGWEAKEDNKTWKRNEGPMHTEGIASLFIKAKNYLDINKINVHINNMVLDWMSHSTNK